MGESDSALADSFGNPDPDYCASVVLRGIYL
jgi:hypothetical protein